MKFVFVDRQGPINTVIRLVDGGPFSHCGVIYTDNRGQSRVIEATFEEGLRDRSLGSLLFATTHYEILDLPLPGELQARMWALSQVGKGYDFGALPALALRMHFGTAPRWDAKGRWYCAEHVLATCCSTGELELREPMRRHGVRAAYEQLIAWGARSLAVVR